MVVARIDRKPPPPPPPPPPKKIEDAIKDIGKAAGKVLKQAKIEKDASSIGGAIAKAKLELGATDLGKKIGEGVKDLGKGIGKGLDSILDKIKDGKITPHPPCKCCHIHTKGLFENGGGKPPIKPPGGAQTLAAGAEQGGGWPPIKPPGGAQTLAAGGIEGGGQIPTKPPVIQTAALGGAEGGIVPKPPVKNPIEVLKDINPF